MRVLDLGLWVLLNTYDQDEERVAQGGEREYFTERNLFEDDNFFPSLFNVKFAIKDLNNDGLVDVLLRLVNPQRFLPKQLQKLE